MSGRVKSFVKKLQPQSKFEIKTPLAAAAVRGTVFEMGFDDEKAEGFLEVNSGVVALSQDDRQVEVLTRVSAWVLCATFPWVKRLPVPPARAGKPSGHRTASAPARGRFGDV